MKKYLAILLSAAALAGCSKKDDNIDKSDPALRDFAATAKIEVLITTSDIIKIKLIADPARRSSYKAAIEFYKDESFIRHEIPLDQPLTISGLTRNSTYKARLIISNVSESRAADSVTVTTPAYSINYKKIYSRDTPDWINYFNSLKMVGIEGGTQIFYGDGFSAQANTAVLIPKDNSSGPISLTVNTINDNELSIKFPADLIPNTSPYVDFKNYFLKINNEVVRSFIASVNNDLDSATLKMLNKDIVLDSAKNNPAGNSGNCMYVVLHGRFMNQNLGVSPKFIQGIQAIPAKTEVEIFEGTSYVNTIELTQGSHAGCDNGFAVGDGNLISGSPAMESMLTYNEVHDIVINTGIRAGTYNMNVKFTLDDGTIVRTNKVICVVGAK